MENEIKTESNVLDLNKKLIPKKIREIIQDQYIIALNRKVTPESFVESLEKQLILEVVFMAKESTTNFLNKILK